MRTRNVAYLCGVILTDPESPIAGLAAALLVEELTPAPALVKELNFAEFDGHGYQEIGQTC